MMPLKQKIKGFTFFSISLAVLSFLFISNALTNFSFAQNQAASNNCWINVTNGKQVVRTGPPGWDGVSDEFSVFVRVPCPPPTNAIPVNPGTNVKPSACLVGQLGTCAAYSCPSVQECQTISSTKKGAAVDCYICKEKPKTATGVPPTNATPVNPGTNVEPSACLVGQEGTCASNPCPSGQECQTISSTKKGAMLDCYICKEKPKTATGVLPIPTNVHIGFTPNTGYIVRPTPAATNLAGTAISSLQTATGVPPTNAIPVNPGTNVKPSACLVGQEGTCASNPCPSGQECQTITSTKKGAAVDCYICKEKPKTATGGLISAAPLAPPMNLQMPFYSTPATGVAVINFYGRPTPATTVTITNQLTGEKHFLVIEHPYERNVLNRAGDPTVFAPASVMALAKVDPSTGMIPNVNGVLKKITDFMGSLNAGFGPAGITTTGTLSGAQLTNALKSSLSSGGSYGSRCFDGVQQQADKEAGGKSDQAVSEDQIKTSEDAGAPAVSGPMVSCGTQNGNKVLKVYAADGQLIDSITQGMLKSDPDIILKELGVAQNATDKLMLKTNNVKPPMDQALAQKQNQDHNAGPVVPNDPLYQLPAKKKRTGIFAILGGEAPAGPHPELDVKDQYYLRAIGYTPLSDPNSAWNVVDATQKNVVVAIVDSGLDLSHPDGPQYLWTNPVDGSHGWNFVDENTDLTDYRGHGTFVAGIIAAKWNNGIGIAGINPGAVIMPIKVTDNKGRTDSFAVYRGINFAVNHGAKIINLSIGGRTISKLEQQAIERANAMGVLVVIAAGNYNESLMTFGPASSKYALAVGMVDFDGQRSQVSNWGPNLQVVAPGEQIWSLCSKDTKEALPSVRKYGYYKQSGTSFSAPMVTATASLIWAKDPQLTSQQVADIIRATATPMKNTGWNDRTGFGLLNAGAALRAAAGDQLIAMITNMHFNRDVRGRLTSLDIYGTVRGSYQEFTIEAGRGKMPLGFRKIAGPFQGQYNYQLIARLVIHDVLRGSDEWVLRLRVIDDQGKAHDASTSFNFPGK